MSNLVISFSRFSLVVESILWLLFLLMVIIAGFVTGGYSEAQWLLYSTFYYAWFSFFLIYLIVRRPKNHRRFTQIRFVLVLLILSLLWLALPLFVPFKHYLHDLLVSERLNIYSKPDWFTPLSIWSVSPERTRWLVLSEVMMLCAFVATLVLLDSRKRLKQLIYVFIFVATVHALIGIFGVYANVLFVEAKEVDGHYSAARGLFVNRNHYASFLILGLFGTLSFALRSVTSKAKKINFHQSIMIILSLVLLAGIFLSQSRGAVIGLVAGSVCAISFAFFMGVKVSKVTILLTLMVVVLTLVYFGQTLLGRFSGEALSLGERTLQWRVTLQAIFTNPWFGYGGGSYITVFQIFRTDVDFREVVFAQAHNHYLHLWLERGLIGLGLWLAIFGLVISQAVARINNVLSKLIRGVLIAGVIIVISTLTQSLVDYNLQNLNIRFYFYVLMAAMCAAPYVKHKK